ncbi:regulator of chromosome condensation 1/beta-lactamase-inhibitor protein II [Leucosporidium creatinivorum]|uniref:Regulator of chromosome condensation 1/beta-lactamase-inhibitor protein II n=1 Tax=Leucosporidium creatinivorum TaxID=106004 RepID=A0A1Y2G3J5_9BASI|nr:regulator of chromosome condensation 1/beta-lactamase-inhibitor protein II [Leucosporidium creatinivorum]
MADSTLLKLPLDLLTDNILPLLPPSALTRLGATNRDLHAFIEGAECEILWKRKAVDEFHFPANASGRRAGWKSLYQRLTRQSAFVWGENGNGRLGIAQGDNSLRSQLIQRGLTTPTLLELPSDAPPVSLSAGGWSFHALTTSGNLVSWGTLDGGTFVMGNAPLSDSGRTLFQPTLSPLNEQLGEIAQVEAGRKHVLLRNVLGEVWEMRSFGRAVRVEDEEGRWGVGAAKGREVVAVEAAWEHSAILTADGNAFIWWEPGPMALTTAAEAAGEANLSHPATQGVAFPFGIETVQLPAIPSPESNERITLIASGDTFIIALTSSSRLFFCDISPVPNPAQPFAPHGSEDAEDSPVRGRASRSRLEAAFLNGTRGWRLMSRFCDIEQIRSLDAFKDSPPPESTRITHVSAHYQSFSVYSVPASADPSASIVLMGKSDWSEESEPVVIPELQARARSHTPTGQLLAWGAYSSGALGLGHPQLLNTPLSAPWPPPAAARSPSSTALPPLPPQGDFRFPGFAPNREIARPSAPDKVESPMLVRFPGEGATILVGEGERKEGKFVFAITASGWHSGALAVEIAEDGEDGAATKEEEGPRIRLRQPEQASQGGEGGEVADDGGPTTGFAGMMRRGFRVGFAGRGLGRGMRGVGR